jgi:hypothetical protein
MQAFDINTMTLPDTAAESLTPGREAAEEAALESHLEALQESLRELGTGTDPKTHADVELQIARTLVELHRGAEAWAIGRGIFDTFIQAEDWESAADTCDVLFQAEQPQSLCALGQGIWLAVTYPVDPELSVEMLHHVVDETPDDADGAAVAATTALFLADLRTQGEQRESLMFFASQVLGQVARRHSEVESQEAFDLWMERLELKEPDKFLVRLRNVVDVLVQDDWWFDREALQARFAGEE